MQGDGDARALWPLCCLYQGGDYAHMCGFHTPIKIRDGAQRVQLSVRYFTGTQARTCTHEVDQRSIEGVACTRTENTHTQAHMATIDQHNSDAQARQCSPRRTPPFARCVWPAKTRALWEKKSVTNSCEGHQRGEQNASLPWRATTLAKHVTQLISFQLFDDNLELLLPV